MKVLKAMVIDDEAIARQTLKHLIEECRDLSWVGEAGSGVDALKSVQEICPDIVYLDIKMPHVSGLEVAQEICGLTHIVFTTAFDQYALTAFELGAVDYLLKPFGKQRFLQSLTRIQERYSLDHLRELKGIYQHLDSAKGNPHIFVRTKKQIVKLSYSEICRVQAAGNYIEIYAHQAKYLFHLTMAEADQQFASFGFIRVHRSHLINPMFIDALEKTDRRTYLIHLNTDETIETSRSGSQMLKKNLLA